jgi:hypothetical protein
MNLGGDCCPEKAALKVSAQILGSGRDASDVVQKRLTPKFFSSQFLNGRLVTDGR